MTLSSFGDLAMSAYPFASSEKVNETLDVLGTRNIATTQQTILQQILVAIGARSTPPVDDWILATGFWRDIGIWDDAAVWID